MTKNQVRNYRNQNIPEDILNVLKFQQIETFNFPLNPNEFFILEKKIDTSHFKLAFPDSSKNPKNHNYSDLISYICPGYLDDSERCPNCGAAILKSKYIENCCNNIENIISHIPPEKAPDTLEEIILNYSYSDPHFIRYLNRFARPLLQKTSIKNKSNMHSTLFIQGVPYGLDCRYQFLEPMYIISANLDYEKYILKRFNFLKFETFQDIRKVIHILLSLSPTLSDYVHQKLQVLNQIDYVGYVENSYESKTINVSIMNDEIFLIKSMKLKSFKNKSQS